MKYKTTDDRICTICERLIPYCKCWERGRSSTITTKDLLVADETIVKTKKNEKA